MLRSLGDHVPDIRDTAVATMSEVADGTTTLVVELPCHMLDFICATTCDRSNILLDCQRLTRRVRDTRSMHACGLVCLVPYHISMLYQSASSQYVKEVVLKQPAMWLCVRNNVLYGSSAGVELAWPKVVIEHVDTYDLSYI